MSDSATPINLNKPIDFSEVEGGGGALPPGDYVVRVVAAKEGKAKSGNPKIEFEFEVVEGAFRKRRVFYTQTLIKSCLWSFRDLLAGLGFDVSGKITIGNPKKLVGKTVKIKTDIRQYQGKEYTDIKQFSVPENVETEESSDEETDLF